MTTSEANVLLPVLFYRPGLATVPVMRLSLVAKGAGAPHHSIRRPLEVLDQTHAPANVSTLARLLPRYGKLDHYTASYLFPPRGVDQFVHEFPEGLSHLMAVFLGFYALGADATLGGDAFTSKLSGWTASTYPDKQGALQPVAHLAHKLAAIFVENPELEQSGCSRISQVLLSARDKGAIAGLLDRPVDEVGEQVELSAAPLGSDEAAAAQPSGSSTPGLTIHFANDFGAALELVFGKELLAGYRLALAFRSITHGKFLWAVLLLLAFVAVVWGVLGWPFGRGSSTPWLAEVGTSRKSVQVSNKAGDVLWRKQFDTEVAKAEVATDSQGRARVLIGLEGLGAGHGDIVVFDSRGVELWRFPAGDATPYDPPRDRFLETIVRTFLVADLLPEPGIEVVAVFAGKWFPTRVCILNEEGKLLRELWHPGALGGMLRLEAPDRLVLWGCNNGLHKTKLGDGSDTLYSIVFCVEPGQLGGQCPPYLARDVPRAKLLWYKALRPQGRAHVKVETSADRFGDKTAQLAVFLTNGWVLYLDGQGNILGRAYEKIGPAPAEDPPTDLIDILADLDREPPSRPR